MEELKILIKGSYNGSLIFALNPNDIKRARQSLIEANKLQIGFTDFLKLHEEHLRNINCSQDDLKEQLERVKDIRNYFDFD
jgi:hypothetical protein